MEMKVTFPGGARVDAEYNGFLIRTDQPVGAGGNNAAPAPFDYFIASIGTCAGIYVLNFLEQRGLPTDDVRITVSTSRDPERRLLAEVVTTIDLPASFPGKYEAAIRRAVDLCSVKQQILAAPRFSTVVHVGDRAGASNSGAAEGTATPA